MNPPPPPLPASTPLREERRFPWGRVVLAGIALVVLTVVAVPLKWRFNLRREVKRELELCRAAGQPVTLKELAALYPPVPDSENAAIPLLEIWREDDPDFWDAWVAHRLPLPERRKPTYDPNLPVLGGKASAVGRGQPLTPAQRTAAEAWWKSNEARITRVAAALQRPQMRFPLRFQDGFAMRIPHLAELKAEAVRLKLRALLAADAGDTEAAIAVLEAASASARLLDGEPILLSQLVGLANRAIMRRGMEDLLNRQALDPQGLQRLEQALWRRQAEERLRLALAGERAMGQSLFSVGLADAISMVSRQGQDDSDPIEAAAEQTTYRVLQILGATDADRLLCLQTLRQAELLAAPRATNFAAFRGRFEGTRTASRRFPPKIISAMLLPALGKIWEKFAAGEAESDCVLIALALERHRRESGILPVTLAALVPTHLPAVPTDPFNGQPLRYQRLDRGYVVYSVGPDGVDDDGRPRDSSDKQQQTWDLPFTVERPDLSRPGAPPFQRGGDAAPAGGEE